MHPALEKHVISETLGTADQQLYSSTGYLRAPIVKTFSIHKLRSGDVGYDMGDGVVVKVADERHVRIKRC